MHGMTWGGFWANAVFNVHLFPLLLYLLELSNEVIYILVGELMILLGR